MTFKSRRAFSLAIEHNYFAAIQFDPSEMGEDQYLEAMGQVRAGPVDGLTDEERGRLIEIGAGFAITDTVRGLDADKL